MKESGENSQRARARRRFMSEFAELELGRPQRSSGVRWIYIVLLLAALSLALYDALHW